MPETLESLVERIYPESAAGPGAARLGVAAAIRGWLDSPFGRGEDSYAAGPFPQQAPPEFGWQSRTTRLQALDAGLAALEDSSVREHGVPFADLGADLQNAMIRRIEAGTIEGLSAREWRAFFELLLDGVFQALFIAPAQGAYSLERAWDRLVPGGRS